MNDLHEKPSDAVDCSKWWKMIRRVTVIVIVMLSAEYEL